MSLKKINCNYKNASAMHFFPRICCPLPHPNAVHTCSLYSLTLVPLLPSDEVQLNTRTITRKGQLGAAKAWATNPTSPHHALPATRGVLPPNWTSSHVAPNNPQPVAPKNKPNVTSIAVTGTWVHGHSFNPILHHNKVDSSWRGLIGRRCKGKGS